MATLALVRLVDLELLQAVHLRFTPDVPYHCGGLGFREGARLPASAALGSRARSAASPGEHQLSLLHGAATAQVLDSDPWAIRT